MSEIPAWRYYKHAMVPNVAPHEDVDLSMLESGEIWKENPKALLARWTTDFDCGYETNWWYLIKDEPFDIDSIKAKRRYEITKGNRNFEVRKIQVLDFSDDLYQVAIEAYADWPVKYRPCETRENFMVSLERWKESTVYAAFSRESGVLCAYALLRKNSVCIDFQVLRARPQYESKGVNAATVYAVLKDNEQFLKLGGYITDGERNIIHETAFAAYLERYFGFRKAYCDLHVQYRPIVGFAVRCLYPFRNILKKLDGLAIVNKVNGVLRMESYATKKNG